MSKHILKIREYNRTTKETLKEWDETFYSFFNAERRQREIEDFNKLDVQKKAHTRFKTTLTRNPNQREFKHDA